MPIILDAWIFVALFTEFEETDIDLSTSGTLLAETDKLPAEVLTPISVESGVFMLLSQIFPLEDNRFVTVSIEALIEVLGTFALVTATAAEDGDIAIEGLFFFDGGDNSISCKTDTFYLLLINKALTFSINPAQDIDALYCNTMRTSCQ
jgi:hypothetical protein